MDRRCGASEIIDFVGTGDLQDPQQVGRVGQVSVMQRESPVGVVRILVQVVNAIGVE